MGLLILAGCASPPARPPRSDRFGLDELALAGAVRSDGRLVQALLTVASPRGPVRLAGDDEVWLEGSGESAPVTDVDGVLVAQIEGEPAQVDLVYRRVGEERVVTVVLPPGFDVGADGLRLDWSPLWERPDTGLVWVEIGALGAPSLIRRELTFDQGWYEIQAAELPEDDSVVATVFRADLGGVITAEQRRSVVIR